MSECSLQIETVKSSLTISKNFSSQLAELSRWRIVSLNSIAFGWNGSAHPPTLVRGTDANDPIDDPTDLLLFRLEHFWARKRPCVKF